MSCEKIKPLLEAYLDGQLPPGEIQRVDDHLASCADCQKDWEDLQALHNEVSNLSRLEAPPGFKESIMERISTRRGEGARGEASGRTRNLRHLMPMSLAAALIIMGMTVYLVYIAQDFKMGPDAKTPKREGAYFTEEERKAPSRDRKGGEPQKESADSIAEIKKAPPTAKRLIKDKQEALSDEPLAERSEDQMDHYQVLEDEDDIEAGKKSLEDLRKVREGVEEQGLADEVKEDIKVEFLVREDGGLNSGLVAYWVTGSEAWTMPQLKGSVARGRVTAVDAETAPDTGEERAASRRLGQAPKSGEIAEAKEIRKSNAPSGPGVSRKGISGGVVVGTAIMETNEWEYLLLEVDHAELEALLSQLLGAKPDGLWKSTLKPVEAQVGERTRKTREAYIAGEPTWYASNELEQVWPKWNERILEKEVQEPESGFSSGRGRKARDGERLEASEVAPGTSGKPMDRFGHQVLKISPYPGTDTNGEKMAAERDRPASVNKQETVRKILLFFPKGAVRDAKNGDG